MNHDHHDVAPAPDHRDLNQHLDIFATDPLVGSGLPLWLPNGSIVREELERLARDIWLAPAQVCVMPVGPAQDSAARELVDALIAAGLRPRLEVDGSLGARIRASRQRRDCVMAVLGAAEVDRHQVQVTDIGSGYCGPVARDKFVETLQRSSCDRTTTVNWPEAQTS